MPTTAPHRVLVAHQPAYLPWPGFFTRLLTGDVNRLVLLDHVQFSKQGWQNRNTVSDRWGNPILLTVPIRRHHGQTLADTHIAGTEWTRRHWRTLRHNYGKAPFWPAWCDRLEAIYHTRWNGLTDLSETLIRLLADGLNLPLPITRSSTLSLTDTKTAMLVELCRQTDATVLRVGTGATQYLDVELLHTAGITTEVATFQPTVPLGLRATGSLLDTLLWHGPATRELVLAGADLQVWRPRQVVAR